MVGLGRVGMAATHLAQHIELAEALQLGLRGGLLLQLLLQDAVVAGYGRGGGAEGARRAESRSTVCLPGRQCRLWRAAPPLAAAAHLILVAARPDVTDPAVNQAWGLDRQLQRRLDGTAVVVAAHDDGLDLPPAPWGAGSRRVGGCVRC